MHAVNPHEQRIYNQSNTARYTRNLSDTKAPPLYPTSLGYLDELAGKLREALGWFRVGAKASHEE